MRFISKLSTLTLILLLSNVTAFGQVSNATIEEAVKDLGGKAVSASVEITQPQTVVPKYNNDQTGNGDLFGSGEIVPLDSGNTKISNCANKSLDSNLYTRQECEGINFVSQNRSKRPNMTVTTNDPIIGNNRVTTSNPVPILDKYGFNLPKNSDGSIGSLPSDACKPTSVVINAQYEDRVCSNYKAGERFLCKQNLIATVIPHFNYRCDDIYGVNSTEKCSKVLQVTCEPGANNCAPNGINPSSFDADMAVTFNDVGDGNFRINFGVYQDDYWTGSRSVVTNPASIYYRRLSLQVNGKERLTRFTLDRIHADDYTLIKVNGTVVYATPPIIDRIENEIKPQTKNGETFNRNYIKIGPNSYFPGGSYSYVERSPSFDEFAVLNRDLRYLLVDGLNTIETWTLVGGRGELYTEWTTQMYCPAKCSEAWQNNCLTLEGRAK